MAQLMPWHSTNSNLLVTARRLECFLVRPNELTMPSSRKVHNNTWLWRNPVEFPWFFVKNVLISTAVSDVDLLPADQNMADSHPACFLQPQWPPLATQKARAAASAQTACSLVRK